MQLSLNLLNAMAKLSNLVQKHAWTYVVIHRGILKIDYVYVMNTIAFYMTELMIPVPK